MAIKISILSRVFRQNWLHNRKVPFRRTVPSRSQLFCDILIDRARSSLKIQRVVAQSEIYYPHEDNSNRSDNRSRWDGKLLVARLIFHPWWMMAKLKIHDTTRREIYLRSSTYESTEDHRFASRFPRRTCERDLWSRDGNHARIHPGSLMSGCQAVARVAYVFLRKSKRRPIIPSKFEILHGCKQLLLALCVERAEVHRSDQHPLWKRGGEACKNRWIVYDNGTREERKHGRLTRCRLNDCPDKFPRTITLLERRRRRSFSSLAHREDEYLAK